MSSEAVKHGWPEMDFPSINRAFSKQSLHFDQEDKSNPVLAAWRRQVYDHVHHFLTPASHILELNSGTGIDALYFVEHGHTIHCTDLSDGMIRQLELKKRNLKNPSALTYQQCSFDALDSIEGPFDYVFSNFGGLNCIKDLAKVAQQLPRLLKSGVHVTWVVMPPVSLWEVSWIFKGNGKTAFRRFNKGGVLAHLEGEHFKTYYHPLSRIKNAFGKNFMMLKAEGLGALTPPPATHEFLTRHPRLYRMLCSLEARVRNNFPFNRWADHIIVTFQFKGNRP